MLSTIFTISISAILIENLVLSKFLGIDPFLGFSKKPSGALSMGLSVTFVLTIASALIWFVQKYILLKFKLEFLQIAIYMLIIVCVIQLIEILIKKFIPVLNKILGKNLSLIAVNSAVLGITLINLDTVKYPTLIYAVVTGFMSGVGFLVVILIFSIIMDRIEVASDIPESFKGAPIALISAAIMAMIFMAFNNMDTDKMIINLQSLFR